MKQAKRIAALLLTMVMVLALCASAFAATTEKGSITIEGALPGNTYTIYKIFDLDSYTNGDTTTGASYAYTITETDDLYNYIDTMTITKDNVAVDVFTLNKKPGTTNVYYVTLNTEALGGQPTDDGDIANKIAQNLLTYITTNGIAYTQKIEKLAVTGETKDPNSIVVGNGDDATKRNITFNNLDLGYYLVDTTAGTMLGLTTTKPTATITAKNKLPTITKQVMKHGDGSWGDGNSKAFGETVTFRTTVKVEAGAENYIVYDKMGAGLDFQGITKIYYASDAPVTDRTIYDKTDGKNIDLTQNKVTIITANATDNNNQPVDFKLVFDNEFVDTVYHYGDLTNTNHNIYIEYEAVVTKDAAIGSHPGDKNKNETWLTYGNGVEVSHSETTTYVFAFDVVKTDNSNKVLNGAKFELYGLTTGDTRVLVPLVFVRKDGDVSVYRVTTADDANKVTVFEAGHVRIEGVGASFADQGRPYYLKEIDAPAGYNKLAEMKEIRIDGKSELKATVTGGVWQEGSGGLRIENNKGSLMPATGGIGTTIFYVVGGILAVGAVVLLVTKRRMNSAA